MSAILIVMTLVAGPGSSFAGSGGQYDASSVAMQEFKSKQSCEAAREVVLKNSASKRSFAVCVDNVAEKP